MRKDEDSYAQGEIAKLVRSTDEIANSSYEHNEEMPTVTEQVCLQLQ